MHFPNITKLACLLLALLLPARRHAWRRRRSARAARRRRRPSSGQPATRRTASCGCCRRTRSPSTASTSPAASSPIRRPPERCSLFDQSGERSAAIFYTAYVAKGADAASRPITFVFNGGPGAASAFLNLGAVGPRIVEFGPTATTARLRGCVDNPDTWLAFTDLVMIDPVGAGWSRPPSPTAAARSGACERDAEALAKTIALYLAKNGRRASPKYLLGESYGGFRAVKVARALQREQGIIGFRHRHGVAADRRALAVRRHAFSARRGAAFALAGGGRAGAQGRVQPRGAGRSRAVCAHRVSDDARRSAAEGRGRAQLLQAVAEISGLPETS